MKLWGGRFDKEVEQIMDKFNSSIKFDKRFYYEDIQGSLAHVEMLYQSKIVSKEEYLVIEKELKQILNDIESGELIIADSYEDIHSFVEIELTRRIGDVGKKLHTGRSRNDQVAVDMKLYTKKITNLLLEKLNKLNEVVEVLANNNNYLMPGYTHLQRAQVVTFKYHLLAYYQMFKRDILRINNALVIMDESPLGCGALAGTTHNIDRELTANILGFSKPVDNFMDGVSDRDYLLELMSCFAILMMHMSRISEELIIWSSQEFKFVTIDSSYSTGSSIMPQKKNPDGAELIRGKTGRVYGNLITLLVTLKGLTLTYNKDMQEDKEAFFDAIDTTADCVTILTGMLETLKVNPDNLKKAVKGGFLNATALADYLVNKGMFFRDAHEVVGKIVQYGEQNNLAIEDIELTKLKQFCQLIEDSVYQYIDYENLLKMGNKVEIRK